MRRRRRTRARGALVAVAIGVAAAGVLAACSSGATSGAGASPSEASTGGAVTGPITVLAAASLQEAFTDIGRRFEAANPGTTVTFSFAASSALAAQLTSGAPADVFASASTATMQTVVDAGRAEDPVVSATNRMEVAVPPANPGQVTGLADLADPAVTVALCQPQVPCGAAAAQVLANAGLTVTPVTLEPDVKAVLGKVTLGEVDAGIVYVTDVQAAGTSVTGIEIPADVNASTSYPIAPVTDSANPTGAQAFVDYVGSPVGRAVLTAAGFGAP